MNLFNKILISCSLVCSIITIPIITILTTNNYVNQLSSELSNNHLNKNNDIAQIDDDSYPTDMSVYIKNDVANTAPINDLVYEQTWNLRRNSRKIFWNLWGGNTTTEQDLNEQYSYKASSQYENENKIYDGFIIDWNQDNPLLKGYWKSYNLNTGYQRKWGSDLPRNHNINFFYNYLGQGNKNSVNLKDYIISSTSNLRYFNFDLNSDLYKNTLINDFNQITKNYSEHIKQIIFLSGSNNWHFETYLDDISKLDHKISGANIGDAKFWVDMLNFDLDIPIDDNGLIFNANTSQSLVKRMFGFSKIFSQIKTIQYAYLLRERINNEVIKLCHGSTLDLDNVDWTDVAWNEQDGWKKENVRGFIKQINDFKFANYSALWDAESIFFATKKFDYFNVVDGTYQDIAKTIRDNYMPLSQLKLSDFKALYDLLIMMLKSYNIVVNAQVWDKAKLKYEDVTELDNNGLSKIKDIVLWDGEIGDFNLNFINDIGKYFTNWNDIRFKINNAKVVENKNYAKNNLCKIGFENDNFWEKLKQKGIEEEIYTKYRFNAINYDLIVLDKELRYKWMKYLSIFSDYKLAQLVHLNNDINKNYFVNDLVVSETYNPNKIILKSLNENMFVTTNKESNAPYRGYPLFSNVISGIGIGDLNKYFNFDTNPFFNLDSWNNALNKFDIISDKKTNKYPIYAASYDENAFYVIATIDNWYFEDGEYGNFINLYKQILKNQFKKDLQTLEIDSDYLTMAEIKPNNYYDKKGNWDSTGYFLVKLNAGSSDYSWFPSQSHSEYKIKEEDLNLVQDQYIKPIDLDVSKPYLNAGIVSLYKAKNEDGIYRYWQNNLINRVDKDFFKTNTYKEINWELDLDLLMSDLEIERENQIRFRYLADLCQNWIKSSNKFDEATRTDYLNALSSPEYRFSFVKSAFKYFLDNVMIKVNVNQQNANQTKGFSFSSYEELKYNWLFIQLLSKYGYQFDDLFIKRKIYVCDEETKSTQLVLNPQLSSTLSNSNFTRNKKIITNQYNKNIIVNKSSNFDSQSQEITTSVFIPSNILELGAQQKHFYFPKQWYRSDYDPFKTNNFFDSSPVRAMWLVDGIKERLYTIKYNNDKLVKIDEKSSLNTINILLITLVPIAIILLFFCFLILWTWIKKKII